MMNEKQFIVELETVLEGLSYQPNSRVKSIVITKIDEAILWLGKGLDNG